MPRALRPHTLLFALYPVLFLYSRNMAEVHVSAIVVPLALVLAAAVVLTLALDRPLGRGVKAGIVVSAVLVLFFSYGHLYEYLYSTARVRHRLLLPAWVALMAVMVLAIVRTRRPLARLDRFLTVVAVTAVATTLVTIGSFMAGTSARGVSPPLAAGNITASVAAAERPDIYYIVVDSYASEPILRELYGHDNRPFLSELERRGFTIARNSRSNYSMTLPSTAATLNMDYLEGLTPLAGTRSKNTRVLCALIDSNRVERILHANGYRSIRIDPPPEMFYHDFPGMLLRTTMLAYGEFSNVANRIEESLRRLSTARPTGPPAFVYAHIMCPHRPYVFGRRGERKSLLEQNRVMADPALRRRAYLEQVEYMNGRILAIVDGIQARRDRRSIIVLQADHGPRNEAPMDRPTGRSLREGSGILNAYCLPPAAARGLYDSISPVNTFRLVFRDVFGLDYPPLPDRSYHNWPKHQFQSIPVGDRSPARDDSPIAGDR